MKIEILNIAHPISAEAAEQAGASLKGMTGIQNVLFFDSPASLHAQLGDNAPTRAEMVAVLAGMGVQVEAAAPRAHAGGGCCGGCGS